jgi:exosortase K
MKVFGKENLSVAMITLYLTGLLTALALKYGFSRASSDELLWMLAPTAFLVEWITGVTFFHESPIGFINAQQGIIIAPACSGMNFMILSFCMLFFSFTHRFTKTGKKWQWFLLCIMGAYFATIAVNATRITVSMLLIFHDVHYGWLTAERIHRAMGIFIYLPGLFLLYFLMNVISARMTGKNSGGAYGKTAIALIPLCWYFLITIVLPLFNGSKGVQGKLFFEHCFTIIILGVAMAGMIYGIQFLLRKIRFRRLRDISDNERKWKAGLESPAYRFKIKKEA